MIRTSTIPTMVLVGLAVLAGVDVVSPGWPLVALWPSWLPSLAPARWAGITYLGKKIKRQKAKGKKQKVGTLFFF